MSTTTRAVALSAVAAAALSITMSACSGSDAESSEAEACSAIAEFQTAVGAVDTLTEESTVEEIRGVRDGIQASYSDLVASLDDVADDRRARLEDAYEAFDASVDDLPDDATVSEALASLQEEAAAISSAREAVADELSCD